jgi:hypothetical protein
LSPTGAVIEQTMPAPASARPIAMACLMPILSWATVARRGLPGKMADLVCPPPVSARGHPDRRLALGAFEFGYRDLEGLLAESGLERVRHASIVEAINALLNQHAARHAKRAMELTIARNRGFGRRGFASRDHRAPALTSAAIRGEATIATPPDSSE